MKSSSAAGYVGSTFYEDMANEAMFAKAEPNPSGIRPTEFKIVVFPKPVEEKIGSILLPEMKKEAEKYATQEGRIVAISPLAFNYVTQEEWGDFPKPKVGDNVLFAKYAGLRRTGKDGKDYIVMSDKDVVAIIDD